MVRELPEIVRKDGRVEGMSVKKKPLTRGQTLIEYLKWIKDNPVSLWRAPVEFFLYMQKKERNR